MEDEEVGKQLWIQLSNTRISIRIGLVYAPQESRTMKNELKKMYDKIEKQVQKGKSNKQKTIVVGDFNCKIGGEIQGNTEQTTKGGKLLKDLTTKNDLEILNSLDLCEGKWARSEHGKNSINDYVLLSKEEVSSIKTLKIDENKEITPYAKKEGKRTYTDHNMITIQIKWILTSQQQTNNRCEDNPKRKKKTYTKLY